MEMCQYGPLIFQQRLEIFGSLKLRNQEIKKPKNQDIHRHVYFQRREAPPHTTNRVHTIFWNFYEILRRGMQRLI